MVKVLRIEMCSIGPGKYLDATDGPHGHVVGEGKPQGEGGDGHGDGVGHGEGLEALEWSHGHVGGDGRPQGEGGMDFTKWFMSPNLSIHFPPCLLE